METIVGDFHISPHHTSLNKEAEGKIGLLAGNCPGSEASGRDG